MIWAYLDMLPKVGYKMTTITCSRTIMHFKSFYVLIIMRHKLQFAFELVKTVTCLLYTS